MALILTPLATDNFSPNANPLNPAHWTQWSGDETTGSLRATSGQARAQSADTGLYDGNYYSGVATPNDQYVTATLARWILGNGQEADIFLRSDTTGQSTFYGLVITDNDDGITANIYIVVNADNNTIYDNESAIVHAGDVFTFAAVGSLIYLYQNGSLMTPPIADTEATSGVAGLFVSNGTSSTDAAWSNFIVGGASLGGPVTSGTVFPGPYTGTSLATAFPNIQGLDIFQVVNEGGKIVWNLDKTGVATVNPTNPTPGTLLGQFEGSTFAAAFPNPYQLNVFQVVKPGGGVVFYVDYQGNAVTP